jgi:hypothetical protein
MKKRKVIYFGEELEGCTLEVTKGGVLLDGRPLVADTCEESDFNLDDATQTLVEESLQLVDMSLPFEDNAQKVANYLSEKGCTVKRAEFYGDVLLETDEGWGLVVLFNEEARITEVPPGSYQKESLGEGLVIVDKGAIVLIPKDEAAHIEDILKTIYASEEDFSTKIRKIQDLLGIAGESAEKLLKQHSRSSE